MSDAELLGALSGLHILFAAIFVGANVFLDFLLAPRLDLIPPGQAARLGEKLGMDFAILSWVSLVGLAATGLLLAWRLGFAEQLVDPDFYFSRYGAPLLVKMTIWWTLVASGAILTFYLRPRVVVKLPYSTSRTQVESAREATVQNAAWMRRLARYNAIASSVAILSAGFLGRGGF